MRATKRARIGRHAHAAARQLCWRRHRPACVLRARRGSGPEHDGRSLRVRDRQTTWRRVRRTHPPQLLNQRVGSRDRRHPQQHRPRVPAACSTSSRRYTSAWSATCPIRRASADRARSQSDCSTRCTRSAGKGRRQQLADEACHIEMDVLGEPIGKQDAYAAAFGGLNLLRFETNGCVVVEPRTVDQAQTTGSSRTCSWSGPATSVRPARCSPSSEPGPARTGGARRDARPRLRGGRHAGRGRRSTQRRLGDLLDRSWRTQAIPRLECLESDDRRWYDAACSAGAWGGKVCGAGGGGFFLFIAAAGVSRADLRARSGCPACPWATLPPDRNSC